MKSDHLRARHGFFGRRGGVSEGIYNCLNCGFGSDDNPDHVAENRARVQDELSASAIQTCHQIHSATAVFVSEPGPRPKADGLVTKTPGLALGALSADCAPVLFEDVEAGIIGACHAGWKGAVTGITDATVALMREHGARHIRAVVGPCISLQSYEVGESFREAARAHCPKAENFFAKTASGSRPWMGDDLHFDLPNYVVSRLRGLDVEASQLDVCTYALPDTFFSYRYTTHHDIADYGRNISAICLTP